MVMVCNLVFFSNLIKLLNIIVKIVEEIVFMRIREGLLWLIFNKINDLRLLVLIRLVNVVVLIIIIEVVLMFEMIIGIFKVNLNFLSFF